MATVPYIVIALAVPLSYCVTLLVERYAARLGLVQPPNSRSSHTIPTPRGGGLSIAITGLVATAWIASLYSSPIMWLVLCLGLVISVLGFVDDLRNLSSSLRFGIQTLVFAALVLSVAFPPLSLAGSFAVSGIALSAILIVSGVWWLNLFNFIDGIDGIAATQAILVLIAASLLSVLAGAGPADPVVLLMLTVAAGSVGFLPRNWSRAHIFMGDVGSNFLAFAIFAVAAMTVSAGFLGYQTWLILLSVTTADAAVTLLRRIANGERPWVAHRRHAYQQLSRRYGHKAITLLYAGLTLLYAAPMALANSAFPAYGWAFVFIAYVPLVIFVILSGAGASEERHSATN